jgi:dimethylhistidine N-methyltransferase
MLDMGLVKTAQRTETAEAGTLLADALEGLGKAEKTLPSKYFYDEIGSRLFEQICETPDYYLTRSEIEIMRECSAEIAAALGPRVRLVEFGNGAGSKTRLLLAALSEPSDYVPVDISSTALASSCADLRRDFPGLAIHPIEADFTQPLSLPRQGPTTRRSVVYFAGSTLGNFPEREAIILLQQMRRSAGIGGAVLLGLDLKKDAARLNAAYNDRDGVTAAFTMNLLQRLNSELGADFKLDQFMHRALYDENAGRIETDIVSRCAQQVRLGDRRIAFEANEAIRVEVSCKYDDGDIARMAAAAQLRVTRRWTDSEGNFAVLLLVPTVC